MGKPVQQSDIDFIMRKYGMLQSLQIHPTLVNAAYTAKSLGKSQINLNTLLCECMAQLYEAQ